MKKKIAEETIKKYVKAMGDFCPDCGSSVEHITFDKELNGPDGEPPTVWQACKCSICDFKWQDVYSLSGIYYDGMEES